MILLKRFLILCMTLIKTNRNKLNFMFGKHKTLKALIIYLFSSNIQHSSIITEFSDYHHTNISIFTVNGWSTIPG